MNPFTVRGGVAYYNEFDPKAAAWLRELIAGGHIAAGDVDERSIKDVSPDDLQGYDQCHFFAGIGGWSLALRLAGWPDDRPVWTGSCPCQPFSGAGRGKGFKDERHLWPDWANLIRERRPSVVFGEQVAAKAGLEWLDLVQTDFQDADYACAPFDICAAGVGAPHWRQRLWFVAERLADGDVAGPQGRLPRGPDQERQNLDGHAGRSGAAIGVADAGRGGRESWGGVAGSQAGPGSQDRVDPTGSGGDGRTSPLHGPWRNADWLHCTDGKWRPVEPGTFPLADGVPDRVGLLRGYGNAIVPQVAQQVIEAYLEHELSVVSVVEGVA